MSKRRIPVRRMLTASRFLASASLASVLVAIATSAGCATAPTAAARAPAQPTVAADYYPLEPGWKWAYEVERDGDRILAVYAVLERTPDTAVIQAGEERMTYAVTGAGIAQKEGAASGDFVLKNPIALGAEWPVTGGSARVAAVDQTVTVLSGDYARCVVVETLRSDPPRLTRTTYAPGVGPVALEVQVQDQGRFVTTLRASLRGLTKPGEDPLGAPKAP